MLWVRVLFESLAAIVVALSRTITGRSRAAGVLLQPGALAPDFALPGSDGQMHRLSDSRGRAVVLVWFPRAFTGGCTAQCLAIARAREAWGRYAVDVFAMSVDPPARAAAFARATHLDAPILSDVTGDVARQYGVLGPGGFARRWTFYVGADGRLLDVDRSVRAASHGQDIARRLAALRSPRAG
jgi:peroxiredoxin Q/BCP